MLDEYEKEYANNSRIYFYRELLTTSSEGRRIDLLTITATQKGVEEMEENVEGLFPEKRKRALKFKKPTIFVTARVHPGETQGSHMMNGLLNFLLRE